jgi:general secretion pathway protein D
VARAGDKASDLFEKAFGPETSSIPADVKQDVVLNQIAGTVTVMATERQHDLIQQYLESVKTAAQRQVLIEATIAEVRLSNTYQAGVDWSSVVVSAPGFTFNQQMLGGALGGDDPAKMIIGYANPTSPLGNINAQIRLLETFGKTRVLSSPKLMAMNNQTALLKVVDNVVYFEIKSSISQGTIGTQNLQSVTTTAQSVAVGVVLSLTPQIDANGAVTLTVRPTISRITGFKPDPNPLLRVGPSGVPLNPPLTNDIPEIAVREMESVLQLVSGQTAVLGGLMQDTVDRRRNQVPGVGNLPRVGDVFAYRDEEATKSELVIFIRPVVVTNPSLDSEELKHLRKLLPDVDKTGQNP